MRDSLHLVLGQAIWAVAQALLLLYLAQISGLELVGVVTAGFAIFAPLSLLLSFNLRTSIAINLLPNVRFSLLFAMRAITSLVTLIAAIAVAVAVDPDGTYAQCAALLVLTKVIDNIADLIIGVYQRDQRMDWIASSLMVRGAALLAAIGISFAAGLSPLGFSALVAGVYALAFIALDLRRVEWGAPNGHDIEPEASLRETLAALRSNWMSALFPAADNLQQNALRLSATLFFEIKTVGLIGLALTAYAPMQLLVTAVGMQVLPRLRARQQAGDQPGFHRVNRLGMLFGLGIASATVLVAFLVPNVLYALVFRADGALAKEVTVMIGLAHLLLPMSGFMSQSLITSENRVRYLVGPTLAIAAFWLASAVLYLTGAITLLYLCVVALVASALRVWVSWGGHFNEMKDIR